MYQNYTTTIQEVRRDPVGFLRQINRGKIITVIYGSKPFSTVQSAKTGAAQGSTDMRRMLEYAELARASAKNPLDATIRYKEAYTQDLTKKYGLS